LVANNIQKIPISVSTAPIDILKMPKVYVSPSTPLARLITLKLGLVNHALVVLSSSKLSAS